MAKNYLQHDIDTSATDDRLLDSPPEGYIESQCTTMLYQHAWLMSFVVGMAASSFTAYMFLRQVSPVWVYSWLGFFWSVLCVRIGLILLFKRIRPTPGALPSWSRYYTGTVWLNGLAWGLPAQWLTPEDLVLVFFYALVISGFVAGAVPGLAFKIRAFYGFAILTIAPFAVKIFQMGGDTYYMIGVLSVLFLVINTASARISNGRIRKQVLLEYENRSLVRKLNQEKERAEEATLAKSRFLAAASHDLRQPLHALGLFVDTLDTDHSSFQGNDTLSNIRSSTENIVGLLNGLLDISRLDAGAEQPDLKSFPIQLVLDQLERNGKTPAREKNLELRIRPCDVWVRSDVNMLLRILTNIMVNAIKYTPQGEVLVACRRRGENLWLEIYDTGEGIEEENLERIFEEFYQVNNPARDRRKGLGLGLAIVQRLAALLECDLDLVSVPGRGSRFRIALPREESRDIISDTREQFVDDVAGAVILVVDDDAAILAAMETVLHNWSCTPILAESISQALEKLQVLGCLPDLAIMDYRLADGASGIQVINEINSRLEIELPVIIVTGEAAPEQLREVQESSYPLLHKPVSAAELRSLISYLLEKKAAGENAWH